MEFFKVLLYHKTISDKSIVKTWIICYCFLPLVLPVLFILAIIFRCNHNFIPTYNLLPLLFFLSVFQFPHSSPFITSFILQLFSVLLSFLASIQISFPWSYFMASHNFSTSGCWLIKLKSYWCCECHHGLTFISYSPMTFLHTKSNVKWIIGI